MPLALSVTLGLGLLLLFLSLTGRGPAERPGRAAWEARLGALVRRPAGEGVRLRDACALGLGSALLQRA